MKVDANFDGGNIETLSISNNHFNLNIREDSKSTQKQWFYFRATKVKDKLCCYTIENAHSVSYPEAWPTCTIVASYDRKNWFRIATSYDGQRLHFEHNAEHDIVYFSMFEPYSYERHLDLVAWSLQKPDCTLLSYCDTVDHHQVELLQIGQQQSHKKNIWIIARQHPAETMAEWFVEGLLKKLLGATPKQFSHLLANATFYIVPNMNPDGSVAGNLRTNGAGVDLNRSWLDINPKTAPESHFVFQQMKSMGVDLFLDIHGDEDVPYPFIAGSEGIPSYTEKLATLDQSFREIFNQQNADFCIENGYPSEQPKSADLSIACNQVGEYFKCLSLTIEMPFTDNKFHPNHREGWSAKRSKALGESVLSVIEIILPKIS
jgi:murein tripeptide amidase MpaA